MGRHPVQDRAQSIHMYDISRLIEDLYFIVQSTDFGLRITDYSQDYECMQIYLGVGQWV